jgi:FkbM family methyltransferase
MALAATLYETTSQCAPSWLKEQVRKAATRVGCRLGNLPTLESLAAHLLTVFDRLQINCVLDVGAHVGQYGRFLRNIGYHGHIVSFEPILANFTRLEQRCRADAKWTPRHLALGDRDGVLPINVAQVTQFSSFLSPNRYSLERFGGFSEVVRVEPVEMTRLEGIFDACTAALGEARVFLKLDTQGYDLKILEGAGSCLNRVLALQSELSLKPIYEGMTGYTAALSSLSRMGFDVTGMFPVLRDEQMRIVELDTVLVRSGDPSRNRSVPGDSDYAIEVRHPTESAIEC